ncbi:ABC transporter ATP-binding protein [Shewanella aestuarii]|uniref:ABC transporter ATP-binding protein n=1 Tax=Shewanella aestuarii TaxID=1028752 RepID=A0A6G9QM45_9GAMM|nr:ABC transporter ATP-binding protein [Shewanella aestuarii]QIR15135.1 ABC transporter ATP-binding protein [Shewanella aestuarii]
MSETILSVNNLTLEYRTRSGLFKMFTHKALDNISFKIAKGEVFGVLGKNGSGKSSLLQLLAGTLQPDSGTVDCSKDITRALLALGLGFNVNLTGRDNALISCMLDGYTKKQALILVEQINEFAELGHFFDQPVKTYSSGMKSRLGFATAMITEVDILLIDEVLSVGDNTFKKKAESALQNKINGEQTVIFVSHSIEQIKKICDRCIWLEEGKIIAEGNTKEVMEHYISKRR